MFMLHVNGSNPAERFFAVAHLMQCKVFLSLNFRPVWFTTASNFPPIYGFYQGPKAKPRNLNHVMVIVLMTPAVDRSPWEREMRRGDVENRTHLLLSAQPLSRLSGLFHPQCRGVA